MVASEDLTEIVSPLIFAFKTTALNSDFGVVGIFRLHGNLTPEIGGEGVLGGLGYADRRLVP